MDYSSCYFAYSCRAFGNRFWNDKTGGFHKDNASAKGADCRRNAAISYLHAQRKAAAKEDLQRRPHHHTAGQALFLELGLQLVKGLKQFIHRDGLQDGNILAAEKARKKNAKKARQDAKDKANAEETKAMLEGKTLVLKAKTGEGDRLFGSVTTKEVADILQKDFGVTVDKKKIEWKNPIKALGKYAVTIKLYPKVQAQVTLSVEAE